MLAGSSGDGGPRISSGSIFPTWADLQQQTYQYDSTSLNPGAAKVVSILQNVVIHQDKRMHICVCFVLVGDSTKCFIWHQMCSYCDLD
jgi:hypothetical protein